MNQKQKTTVIFCLLATHLAALSGKKCCCGSCGLEKKIDNLFAPFNQMKMIEDNFNKTFDSKKIQFNSYNDKIKINIILGEGITSFDGDATDSKLIIKIPKINKQIIVSYDKKNRFLSVGTEEKQKFKRKNDSSYEESFSCSNLKQGTTVNGELVFEKATFDYKGDTLTITIPEKNIPKKKSKKITVNMK